MNEKNKYRIISLLAKSQLNREEKIISKVLIESNISHDGLTLAINEEKFLNLNSDV